MDLPAEVLIHNDLLGIKGSQGTLVAVSPHGFYEANLKFKNSTHRLLLPISRTVLVFREPEPVYVGEAEIER